MALEDLKYKDNLMYMQGFITKVKDGGVEIDFKGRLGSMSIPLRMLISDYKPEVGQTIGFVMSHPEIESNLIDETYRKVMNKEE